MRYNNIDALRAIGAVGILMMHYLSNITTKPDYGYATELLIPWMTNFVILFFIISAFGLCCGYYDRFTAGTITPAKFYNKRYARILPFFILLSAIDIVFSFSWESLAQGFMNATLTLGLMPVPKVEVIGVGWFLGTIFVFYMMFPFFVFLISSKTKAWWILAVTFVINLLCYYYFFTPEYNVAKAPGRMNILYSAMFLICGGLIYLYREPIYSFNSSRYGYVSLIATVAVTIAYFIVLPALNHAWAMLAMAVLFALWLIYAIAPPKKWMDNRCMNFMGKYSMEIYLSHMLIFRVIERLRLERYIADADMLYAVTCCLGLLLTVLFSYFAVLVIDYAALRIKGTAQPR